eukprot:9484332-Pyramimonas_sp.AAC.1
MTFEPESLCQTFGQVPAGALVDVAGQSHVHDGRANGGAYRMLISPISDASRWRHLCRESRRAFQGARTSIHNSNYISRDGIE